MRLNEWYPFTMGRPEQPCTECGKRFSPPSPNSKTCGPKCAAKRKDRVALRRYRKSRVKK